jgi:hypothetical protein
MKDKIIGYISLPFIWLLEKMFYLNYVYENYNKRKRSKLLKKWEYQRQVKEREKSLEDYKLKVKK